MFNFGLKKTRTNYGKHDCIRHRTSIGFINAGFFLRFLTKLKAQKNQYFDQTQGNLGKTQAKFPKISQKYQKRIRIRQVFAQKARKMPKISLKTQGNFPKTQFSGYPGRWG